MNENDVTITSPIDPREMTVFETEKGSIHIIHEITLGDLLISTLLAATLIFLVITKVIRR
ncbi:hypothetical protein [Niallia sp. 03133]|uniref:hypothetical protein n=1 Tax=Niallia sp. 03133 TaxID=3458060 RepID=UPI004043AB93